MVKHLTLTPLLALLLAAGLAAFGSASALAQQSTGDADIFAPVVSQDAAPQAQDLPALPAL